jgi:hypothetical protein
MAKIGSRRPGKLVLKIAFVLLVFYFVPQLLGNRHAAMGLKSSSDGLSLDLLSQLTEAQVNATQENEPWLLQLHSPRQSSKRLNGPIWVVMVDGNHRQVKAQSTEWDTFEQPRDCILMWVLHRYHSIPASRIHLLNGGRQEVMQRIGQIVEEMVAHQSRLDEPGVDYPPPRLVFCFQGHSSLHGLGLSDSTELTVEDLSEAFATLPKRSELVLHADSCFSGILQNTTVPLEVTLAVLTSAHQMSLATETWAFTDCLIRVYAGDAAVDADEDGWITTEEAYNFCRVIMVVGSQQMVGGTPRSDLVLAPVNSQEVRGVASDTFFEQQRPSTNAANKQVVGSSSGAECVSLSAARCPGLAPAWRKITQEVLLPRIRCTTTGRKAADRLCSSPSLTSGTPVLLWPRKEIGHIASCEAGLCQVRLNSEWWSIWALVSDNATNCTDHLVVVEGRMSCGLEHFLRGIPCHLRRGAIIVCKKEGEVAAIPQEQEWVMDPTLNLWYSLRTGHFHNGHWELDPGSGRWFESRPQSRKPHPHKQHHHKRHREDREEKQ